MAAAVGHYTVRRPSASTAKNREHSRQIKRRLGIRGNGAKRSEAPGLVAGGDGDGDSCGPSTSSWCLAVALDVSCSTVIVDKWTHNVAVSRACQWSRLSARHAPPRRCRPLQLFRPGSVVSGLLVVSETNRLFRRK